MGQTAKPTRQNRTITVDFHNETTYFALVGNTTAFVEFVLAFLLAIGFQLAHKATCRGGGCLTRHSHYARVRLGGLTIWRVQCTTCKAVFTVRLRSPRRPLSATLHEWKGSQPSQFFRDLGASTQSLRLLGWPAP